MAEPLKPSQIIQQQIDALRNSAPPALTQAERDQIMKGRKGQADIDAGRAAIKAREDAIKAHNDQINTLLTQQVEAVNKESGEAKQAQREADSNPFRNTFAPAATGAAIGAGMGEIGNRILHGVNAGNARAIVEIGDELGPSSTWTNSQINRSRMTGAAQAAERFAPSTMLGKAGATAGRLATYGIPAAAFLNEYRKYEGRATDPNATEADRNANQLIANGLLGVGTGIVADGGMRFAFPSRHPGEGQALARIGAARDFAARMDAADARRTPNALLPADSPPARPTIDITPQPAPAQLAPPPAQSVPSQAPETPPAQGSKAYLQQRAKELGLSKQGTKQDLIQRISEKEATFAKRRVRSPKATSVVAPVVGAGVAADAAYNDARAAGETRGQAATDAATAAAVAGGATGAAAYGINKLLPYAPAIGRVLGPVGAAVGAYDAGSAILGGLSNDVDAGGADLALRRGNRGFFEGQQAISPEMVDPFDEALSRFETYMAGNR